MARRSSTCSFEKLVLFLRLALLATVLFPDVLADASEKDQNECETKHCVIIIVILQLVQTKQHKCIILVKQHQYNDCILFTIITYAAEETVTVPDVCFEMEKLGKTSFFLHIKTYPSIFFHSVMLTISGVFPHVVSLLLRGYRNPRLPVKVCCV